MTSGLSTIYKLFPKTIRTRIDLSAMEGWQLKEMRLRVNGSMNLLFGNRRLFLLEKGGVGSEGQLYHVTSADIREMLEHISNYSLYAFEEELKQGFITIPGGHRVGLAGKTVMDERGIKTIKHISFLNIRISHEIKGCGNGILPYIFNRGHVYTTLIISPPCCGKTTLLRDLVRLISNEGINVSVVDERSEIGGCHNGVPQNDLGENTDVLDCCPKSIGILRMLRSMSPQVIAVDEIGLSEDIAAINNAMVSGCKLLCTIHGESYEEMKYKPVVKELLEKQLFDRYVILSNRPEVCTVECILDRYGNKAAL